MTDDVLALIAARRDAQARYDAAKADRAAADVALAAKLDPNTFYSEDPAPKPFLKIQNGVLVEVTPTSLVPAPDPEPVPAPVPTPTPAPDPAPAAPADPTPAPAVSQ